MGFGRRQLTLALAAIAAAGGTAVAFWYHYLGLTLTHYDARAHLVVARRIFDNITPGWQQIGAVWLPLPHVLNALPVQIDFFYRTGASAVALSILSFAVATGAIGWIVSALTESRVAAVVAATVFAANPNVLYLQSTPMTEPLLLALALLGVALLIESTDTMDAAFGARTRRDTVVGCVFALACLTRYEAWPVTATALAFAVCARWRRGEALDSAVRRIGRIAVYPALTLITFAIFS